MGKVFSTVFGSGSSSSGSAQSSGDPIKQEAWSIGKPLYQSTVNQGQGLLTDVFNNPAYSGPRVAGLNPFQTGSADFTGNFALNTGNNAYNLLNAGNANLDPSTQFGANAANLFARYAGFDPTQQILSNANAYANNPYVDGIIDSAGRDVVRQLSEQTLPSLNRAFARTGNTNSTRAGVESAIAQRGATDRLTDMSSDIRGRFFGNGLNMAQTQFNQNLTNALNTNRQLLDSGNLGVNTINAGNDFARLNFGLGQGAGSVYQTQNQNELDANKAFFDESLANRLKALGITSNVAQAGQGWAGGPTSTTTSESTTKTPSIASVVGSIMGAFSDIRMKENIELVGKTAGGINVYDFDYKPEFKGIAGHGRYRGVMADEVEKIIPEAVLVASNGYKMVDYSKVN